MNNRVLLCTHHLVRDVINRARGCNRAGQVVMSSAYGAGFTDSASRKARLIASAARNAVVYGNVSPRTVVMKLNGRQCTFNVNDYGILFYPNDSGPLGYLESIDTFCRAALLYDTFPVCKRIVDEMVKLKPDAVLIADAVSPGSVSTERVEETRRFMRIHRPAAKPEQPSATGPGSGPEDGTRPAGAPVSSQPSGVVPKPEPGATGPGGGPGHGGPPAGVSASPVSSASTPASNGSGNSLTHSVQSGTGVPRHDQSMGVESTTQLQEREREETDPAGWLEYFKSALRTSSNKAYYDLSPKFWDLWGHGKDSPKTLYALFVQLDEKREQAGVYFSDALARVPGDRERRELLRPLKVLTQACFLLPMLYCVERKRREMTYQLMFSGAPYQRLIPEEDVEELGANVRQTIDLHVQKRIIRYKDGKSIGDAALLGGASGVLHDLFLLRQVLEFDTSAGSDFRTLVLVRLARAAFKDFYAGSPGGPFSVLHAIGVLAPFGTTERGDLVKKMCTKNSRVKGLRATFANSGARCVDDTGYTFVF